MAIAGFRSYMVLLLIRILLVCGFVYFLYFLFFKFIPKAAFNIFGMVVFLAMIIAVFLNPGEKIPESVWQFFIFPFKPFGFALILLGVGLVKTIKTSTDKILKTQLSCAFALLLLLSTPIVSNPIVRIYEYESFKASQADLGDRAQAIAVLGQNTTRINLSGGSQIQLTEFGDRLIYAAQLYREQAPNRPKVIISAGLRHHLTGDDSLRLEAISVERILESQGVASDDILRDDKSATIYSSLDNIKKILDKDINLKDQPVFLVTSAFNMGRAFSTAKHLGINQVIAKPTNFYGTSNANEALQPRFRATDLLPSLDTFVLTSRMFEDFWGLLYYIMRDWTNAYFDFHLRGGLIY